VKRSIRPHPSTHPPTLFTLQTEPPFFTSHSFLKLLLLLNKTKKAHHFGHDEAVDVEVRVLHLRQCDHVGVVEARGYVHLVVVGEREGPAAVALVLVVCKLPKEKKESEPSHDRELIQRKNPMCE